MKKIKTIFIVASILAFTAVVTAQTKTTPQGVAPSTVTSRADYPGKAPVSKPITKSAPSANVDNSNYADKASLAAERANSKVAPVSSKRTNAAASKQIQPLTFAPVTPVTAKADANTVAVKAADANARAAARNQTNNTTTTNPYKSAK